MSRHEFAVERRKLCSSDRLVTFVVVDAQGKVQGKFRSLADAARHRDTCQREADRQAKRGPRPCMCCARIFKSEGIHNRLCDVCRRDNQGLGFAGAGGHVISGKSARTTRGGR